MQRQLALPPFVLALGALAVGACSLAVQSELDSKPAGAGGNAPVDASVDDQAAGGTDQDAPADQATDPSTDPVGESAADAADAADAPDTTDAAEEESGACTSCSAEQCCGGACVDTTSDESNCGACGHACGAGRTCTASACTQGWLAMTPAPSGNERARACAVWAGGRVFIWGGMKLPGNELRGDGLTYDPIHDQWGTVGTDANTPAPRAEPVCLWTGSKVFVWGGLDPATNAVFADGALWDPGTDTWEKLETGGPIGRARPVALWGGSRAIVWGGTDPTNLHGVKAGATWKFSSAQWKAMSTTGAPPKNKELAGVWTGSSAMIFGGRDDPGGTVYNTLYAYSPPTSDLWTLVTPTGTAPAVRSSAFVGYASSYMLIWGGLDKSFVSMTGGARVKLTTPAAWETMNNDNAPSARAANPFESGWAAMQGNKMHVLGGIVSSATAATDGGTYDLDSDAWSPIDSWGTAQHLYGIGVWTGSEFVVWGGYDGSTALLDGSRWMP